MIMVGISGTPSTGKSTLARLICSSCKSIPKIKTTELVSEYARKYISKHGPMKEIWEQSRILTRQLEWEDSVKNSTDLLVTDSPVHLSFLYSVDIEKKNEKDIMVFNDIFKILSKLSKEVTLGIISITFKLTSTISFSISSTLKISDINLSPVLLVLLLKNAL